jgi:hypothetical protein
MNNDDDTPSVDIIPFDFEEQAVRVVMRDGDPWFIAADVCRVLELGNTAQAVSRLDDDERDGIITNDTVGRSNRLTAISESGLYALVLTSRKPEARRFRKWITAEVLPALRKRGVYQMPDRSGPPPEPPADDSLNPRDWLNLIREARILGGITAGRRMWARSPLPPLFAAPVAQAVDPEEGRACLAHLMAHDSVATYIAAAFGGSESAYATLATVGLRVKPGGLFVANGNHPGIVSLFVGTDWANGRHRDALLALPGAATSNAVFTLGGVACRGVVIPEALIAEAAHA